MRDGGTARGWSRAGRWAREGVLTALAVLGSACLLLGPVTVVLDLGVIVVRTGSMSPAIPAGAAALVRTVPADKIKVGDVVTVQPPVGKLPVTHRVVEIDPPAPGTSGVVLHLRGDANAVSDPFTYPVTEARRVIVSVPHAGSLIVAASRPVAMITITLTVAALVAWSMWPRRASAEEKDEKQEDAVRGRGPRGGSRRVWALRAVAVAVLVPIGTVAGSGGARADSYPVPETGSPGLLSLRSSLPLDATWPLTSGQVIRWQVEAWLDPLPGMRLEAGFWIQLVAAGPLLDHAGVLTVSLDGCSVQWTDAGGCAGRHAQLLAATAIGRMTSQVIPVDRMQSSQARWIQLTIQAADPLPDDARGLTARFGLGLTATGDEQVLATGGGTDSLARTGADLRGLGLWALLIAAVGFVMHGVARRGRRAP